MTFVKVSSIIRESVAKADKRKKYSWHMSPDVFWQLKFDRRIYSNEEGQSMLVDFPINTILGTKNYIELKEIEC